MRVTAYSHISESPVSITLRDKIKRPTRTRMLRRKSYPLEGWSVSFLAPRRKFSSRRYCQSMDEPWRPGRKHYGGTELCPVDSRLRSTEVVGRNRWGLGTLCGIHDLPFDVQSSLFQDKTPLRRKTTSRYCVHALFVWGETSWNFRAMEHYVSTNVLWSFPFNETISAPHFMDDYTWTVFKSKTIRFGK